MRSRGLPRNGHNLSTEGQTRDTQTSGRRDLNPRPLEPHSSALPSCATARFCCKLLTNYGEIARDPTMKAVIRSNAFVHSSVIAVFVFSICTVAAQSRRSIQLNEDAFTFAAELIKKGHFIADRKGAWTEHRPSADEENEFIRLHGFAAYAKWHLGIDNRFPENTKRRYKFPYGEFENVHRCGLLAVKARAHQYGYAEIENAATELERTINDKSRISESLRLTLPGR